MLCKCYYNQILADFAIEPLAPSIQYSRGFCIARATPKASAFQNKANNVSARQQQRQQTQVAATTTLTATTLGINSRSNNNRPNTEYTRANTI